MFIIKSEYQDGQIEFFIENRIIQFNKIIKNPNKIQSIINNANLFVNHTRAYKKFLVVIIGLSFRFLIWILN